MAGHVLIVSGPPGSGKTTLAAALAARRSPSVHLESDLLYRAIRNGYADPWLRVAHEQNQVVVRAGARAAATFAGGGYFTVVDGVALPWALAVYREEAFAAGVDVRPVVLPPPLEECLRRAAARAAGGGFALEPEAIRVMHAQFAALPPGPGTEIVGRTDLDAVALAALLDAADRP